MHLTFLSKRELHDHLTSTATQKATYPTPAGPLTIMYTEQGIYNALYQDTTNEENLSSLNSPHPNLILAGTDFQRNVWQQLISIEPGKTVSYQVLAQICGHPKGYRAVARALASNPIAYFIPCHRVIGKNGSLTGYKWGIDRKTALLKAEKGD